MDALSSRAEQTAERFRQAAVGRGMFITADDRVSEADAAELLGYATGSLRNMRSAGCGGDVLQSIAWHIVESYRLDDLAAWVERSREETI